MKPTKDKRFQKALGASLARHVGQGREMSVETLAAAVGCSGGLLYGIMRQELTVSVSAETFCAILREAPEAVFEEFIHSVGYSGARRIDGLRACFARLHSMVAGLCHMLAKAREDDRIDATEERELLRAMGPVRSELSRFGGAQSK